jgi:branched-chain amino acid transport system ATP-binding protein
LDTDFLLKLEKVVAGYGKMTILNETTFSVRRGAITTIIGPNGAGKSTVFKTIFGLLPPRGGKIFFDGQEINNFRPRQLLNLGVCYLPQGRNIFPELSVLHNLEFGMFSAKTETDLRERVEKALDRFPILRRKLDAQASTLSGGEQKILELARGLLMNPKLLLIDEPSIGLSPLMAKEMFGILKELRNSGVTVLLVEQNAKSALEMSDYGIVLELGRARLADKAEAILSNPRIAHLFLGGSTIDEDER